MTYITNGTDGVMGYKWIQCWERNLMYVVDNFDLFPKNTLFCYKNTIPSQEYQINVFPLQISVMHLEYVKYFFYGSSMDSSILL